MVKVDIPTLLINARQGDFISDMSEELSQCQNNIVKDASGALYWEQETNDANIVMTMSALRKVGLTKNHEVYRNHYRRTGYKLYDYWAMFYLETNNHKCAEYEYEKSLCFKQM